MKRRRFIATASLVAVAGCTAATVTDIADKGAPEALVEIPQHEWTTLDHYEGVAGIAKNVSSRELDVFVKVEFYNGDTRLEESMRSATGLDAGQSFEFEVPFLGEPSRVDRYQIGYEAYES